MMVKEKQWRSMLDESNQLLAQVRRERSYGNHRRVDDVWRKLSPLNRRIRSVTGVIMSDGSVR